VQRFVLCGENRRENSETSIEAGNNFNSKHETSLIMGVTNNAKGIVHR
jgi:hypothetical protein